MQAQARLILLGAARAEVDGRPVPLGPRLASLLALLALDGPLPRAKLTAWLYPEAGPDAARRNLRQLLFKQRQLLERLVDEPAELLALMPGVIVDALLPLDEGTLLAAEGDLLDGLRSDAPEFGRWLDGQRVRRRAARAEALAALASAHEQAGHVASALSFAERLATEQPTSEHAHRRVMRLHYLRGDRAAALAAFDRCECLLKDELSARPGDETLSLLRTIEDSAAPPQATPALRSPLPASVQRPPRLIGREAERAALLRAWAEQRVVLVVGEAGMGKTRLLGEATAGLAVLAVAARPGDDGMPFALLSRWLRAALGQVAPGLPAGVAQLVSALLPDQPREAPPDAALASPLERTQLANALAWLQDKLGAAGVAGCVVDDLHFADAPSVEALQGIASGGTLRWALGYRPGELEGAARELVERLEAGTALLRVRLVPWTALQIGELLDSLAVEGLKAADLAEPLWRHTGGNPLFVLETLRGLWLQRPTAGSGSATRMPATANVLDAIERRLERLSPPALKLARCAAVAGADFDADLAVSVLGLDTLALVDPWSELEQAHVLRDGVFAHDLLREATLRGLPAALTRRVHGEVAAHLQGRGAEPASVARHWLAAGERSRAAPAAAAAARRAAAAMLVDVAVHWFTTAARLEEEATRRAEACTLWLELAHFAESVSAGSLQDRAASEAERLATHAPHRARAALHRATLLTRAGDYEATIATCRTAMQGLARDDDPILFGMLEDELVGALLWLDRREEALALLADGERYWRGLADSPAADEFYCNLGVTLNMLDRRDEAAAAHRQSIALSRRHAKAANTMTALVNLGVNRGDAGRPQEAIEVLEEAQRLWLSLPDAQGISRANLDANLAFALLAVGRYGEALERIERALEGAEDGQAGFVASYLVTQATLWLHLGQLARALQSADAALQRATSAPVFKGRAHLLKGLVARWRGQSPLSDFDAASGLLDDRGKYLASGQLALARCAEMASDEALAAALAVRREAERRQFPGLTIGADAQLARCALALGRKAEALVHGRAVLEGLQRCHPDVLTTLPAAWLAAGQALMAAGDEQGRAVLEEAARWLRNTAREQVPAPFRDSFLERNPVHRELLAQARRPRADA